MQIVFVLVVVAGIAGAMWWSVEMGRRQAQDPLSSLPPAVQDAVTRLDPSGHLAFQLVLDRSFKTAGLGYVLWFFGSHYAYLGQIGRQLAYAITLGGFGVWAVLDAFRLRRMVSAHNETFARELLAALSGVGALKPVGV